MTESKAANQLEVNDHQADIGLVCALPIELAEFVGHVRKVKTYTGGPFKFRGGFYDQIRIAIVESGMGPARARRATHALLDAHSPKWVISTGFCGALIKEMKIGQIVVSNKIATIEGDEITIDVGMHPDAERGLHVGRTLTIDHMIRTIAEKTELAEKTGAIAVDMETHAIAAVCRERKTRFLAIRAVSDDLSADLPTEILSLVGETGAVRLGAVIGALWKRPSSYQGMWELREKAMLASERLAKFLDGVVKQLHSADS